MVKDFFHAIKILNYTDLFHRQSDLCDRADRIRYKKELSYTSIEDVIFNLPNIRENIISKDPNLNDNLVSLFGYHSADEVISIDQIKAEIEIGQLYRRSVEDFQKGKGFPLQKIIESIYAELDIPSGKVRTCDAHTEKLPSTTPMMYPGPDRIPSLIQELEGALRALDGQPPILSAIAASVGILHCHPFTDGNKRLARALYSAVSPCSATGLAIPLGLLSSLSPEAYTIKMKRALLFGQWEPIVQYVMAATSVTIGLLND